MLTVSLAEPNPNQPNVQSVVHHLDIASGIRTRSFADVFTPTDDGSYTICVEGHGDPTMSRRDLQAMAEGWQAAFAANGVVKPRVNLLLAYGKIERDPYLDRMPHSWSLDSVTRGVTPLPAAFVCAASIVVVAGCSARH